MTVSIKRSSINQPSRTSFSIAASLSFFSCAFDLRVPSPSAAKADSTNAV